MPSWVVAALVGGTASVIGGGKFKNGTQTAAMVHLFNQEATRAQKGGPAGSGRSSQGRNPLSVVGGILGKIWNIPNTILGHIWWYWSHYRLDNGH